MTLKRIATALCCAALLAGGVAEAKRLKIKNLPVPLFQGIDFAGNLDGGAYVGLVKITINLNNGNATISGKAVVPNLSGERAVFVDVDFAGIGTFVHDRYVVKKNGRATYHGRYQDVI